MEEQDGKHRPGGELGGPGLGGDETENKTYKQCAEIPPFWHFWVLGHHSRVSIELAVVDGRTVPDGSPHPDHRGFDLSPVSYEDKGDGEHVPGVPTGFGQKGGARPIRRAVSLVSVDIDSLVCAHDLRKGSAIGSCLSGKIAHDSGVVRSADIGPELIGVDWHVSSPVEVLEVHGDDQQTAEGLSEILLDGGEPRSDKPRVPVIACPLGQLRQDTTHMLVPATFQSKVVRGLKPMPP